MVWGRLKGYEMHRRRQMRRRSYALGFILLAVITVGAVYQAVTLRERNQHLIYQLNNLREEIADHQEKTETHRVKGPPLFSM